MGCAATPHRTGTSGDAATTTPAPTPEPSATPAASAAPAPSAAPSTVAATSGPTPTPASTPAPTAAPAPPPDPFAVPAGMEERVAFWTRIYSEWRSADAVFHDREHLGVIMTVVDVTTLRPPPGASRNEWRSARRVQEAHLADVARRLQAALAALADPARPGPDAFTGDVHDVYIAYVCVFAPGGAVLAPDFFAPIAENPERVRCQTGLRDEFERALTRRGRWLPGILDALRKHDLPLEIAALPFVESMFVNHARSSVGAVGVWQFMRKTARLFMRITPYEDQRLDPLVAAEGAARLLKRNYELLGSWPLAVTAYNHGAGGVMRATRLVGSTHLPDLIQRHDHPSWGFASKNFYASFLAALAVSRDADRIFGPITPAPPEVTVWVKTKRRGALAQQARDLRVDAETLVRLNPALTRGVRTGRAALPAGFALRAPAGTAGGAPDLADAPGPALRDEPAPPPAPSRRAAAPRPAAPVPTSPPPADLAALAAGAPLPELGAARFALRDGRAEVLPLESPGGLAEWCGVHVTDVRGSGRRRNRLTAGQSLDLDCADATAFATRRASFHVERLRQLLATHRISRVEEHRLRSGETPWSLGRAANGVPLTWLLWLYNPGRDLDRLPAGAALRVPVVTPR